MDARARKKMNEIIEQRERTLVLLEGRMHEMETRQNECVERTLESFRKTLNEQGETVWQCEKLLC